MDVALTAEGVAGLAASSSDFDDWVAARGPALMRLAYALTGNRADAEDVVQDALSRALPRWERISAVEDPDAYVRRMVINAHTSWWRKFRRRESPVAIVHDSTGSRPGSTTRFGSTTKGTRNVELWQACRALPEPLRTAVVLRFYEDMEYAAIAAMTGVREGSVRARVSRGVALLRAEVGDRDE